MKYLIIALALTLTQVSFANEVECKPTLDETKLSDLALLTLGYTKGIGECKVGYVVDAEETNYYVYVKEDEAAGNVLGAVDAAAILRQLIRSGACN